MSDPRPPDDFDDVLRQVEDALDQLDIVRGPTRDALLTGVRTALEELGPDGLGQLGFDVETTLDGELPPTVRVVEGGLDQNGGPRDGVRPDLRVAEPGEQAPAQNERAQEDDSGERAASPVRVVRVSRRPTLVQDASNDPTIGRIVLDGPEAWQTVYRGTLAGSYRLACDEGSVQVALDGALVEEIHPGQTSDFSGTLIRVSAGPSGRGIGRYWNLETRDP